MSKGKGEGTLKGTGTGMGKGKENDRRPFIRELLVPDSRWHCDETTSWRIRIDLFAPLLILPACLLFLARLR
jgi:hypothetical protein